MKILKKYSGLIKLGLLVVVAPLVVYQSAIGKSVALWKEYKTKETVIESRLASFSAIDKGEDNDPRGQYILKNGKVLDVLSETIEKNGIKAERYNPYLAEKNAEAELHIAQVVFKGGFIPLTKVLHAIAEQPRLGQIISVEYASSQNNRDKKKELRLSVTLQQISETGKE